MKIDFDETQHEIEVKNQQHTANERFAFRICNLKRRKNGKQQFNLKVVCFYFGYE